TAGGGSLVARRGGLLLPPGCTTAESRFPDDQRECAGAGRRSSDRRLIAGRATGATIRANRGCFRDHIGEFARWIQRYYPVRSQPRHQRRGARRAERNQCRVWGIAQRTAATALLS